MKDSCQINKKYNFAMRLAHHITGAGFILVLIFGFLLSQKIIQGKYFFLHKSFGITIFILIIARILIRIFSTIPMPCYTNFFEKYLAITTHYFLYFVLIFMPLSGYLMSTFYGGKGNSFLFFSLFKVPYLFEKSEFLAGVFGKSHSIFAYISIFLIILHFLGSLKHLIIDKKNIFRRII